MLDIANIIPKGDILSVRRTNVSRKYIEDPDCGIFMALPIIA